jgi:hypothetical protein
MAEARRAGLLEKSGPWRSYSDRMLYARAMGFALRDLFPDVLRGIGIGEEQADIAQVRNVTPARKPLAEDPACAAIAALSGGKRAAVTVETKGCETVEVIPEIMEERGGGIINSSGDPSASLPYEPAPEAPDALRKAIWDRATITSNAHKAAPLIEKFVRAKFGKLDGGLAHLGDEEHAETLAMAVSMAANCKVDLRTNGVK